jgi:hypothetical protein
MPSFIRNTSGGKAISGGSLAPRSRRGNNVDQVNSYWAGGGRPDFAAQVLVLGGGGGGGSGTHGATSGGGGGGGGQTWETAMVIPVGVQTVTVGGSVGQNSNGSVSTFRTASPTAAQSGNQSWYGCCGGNGGVGAWANGGAGGSSNCGSGGSGTANSITGSSVTRGGGGAGGGVYGCTGSGGAGGGANSSPWPNPNGLSGSNGLGGGGSGADNQWGQHSGGGGGSGIVIVRYETALNGSYVVTNSGASSATDGAFTVLTWTGSGSLTLV